MSIWVALQSYLRVRIFPRLVRNRDALHAWQARKLENWLRRDVPRVDAFAHLHGQSVQLEDLPIMDKAELMADFSRYNVPRFTNAQGWEAFQGDKRIGSYTLGASTGTSGNRGLFVVSQRERFAWLGAILAKAVPDFWHRQNRVAVLLPIDTPLYDSANRTKRLTLKFFDISEPLDAFAQDLEAFNPSILIAPPRILRRLAEAGLRLSPERVFSAAEKLEAGDRAIIEQAFGLRLGEIYMATEGLLGVTCSHNRMHLAEDCMHFTFEPVGEDLVMPIISDFSRTTQIMLRYRLNDMLRLDARPCPCGSPLQVVHEIVGREDDIFVLTSSKGDLVELTPDILRNAIVDADRRIDDFVLIQTGPSTIELHLPAKGPYEAKTAARECLLRLLKAHGISPDCRIEMTDLQPQANEKLRRVRRNWKPVTTQKKAP